MSSIRDVAKKAGVSVGSVSRYLNGQKLKEANMKKIAEAIELLDYKENIIAKGLKNNQSFSIGLLMDSISSRFGAEVVTSIESIAEANGYSLLLSGYNGDIALIEKKIDYLLAHSVDGLIVFVADRDWEGMKRLNNLNIPIVSINSPDQLENVDIILSNDRESVSLVMEEIIKKGHKKIGVISAPQQDYVAKERLLGAYEGAKNYPSVQLEIYEGDYSRQGGYKGADNLISKGCTALLVTNFNMSVGSLELMNQKRLRIGEDVLFSHFDYIDKNEYLVHSKIVITPSTKEIGEACASLLIKKMTSKENFSQEIIIIKNKILGID